MGQTFLLIIALLTLSPAGIAQATTITVNTINDELDTGVPNPAPNGKCSLREALQAVNTGQALDSCPAGDTGTTATNTIIFAPSLTGKTILLDYSPSDVQVPMPEQLSITSSGAKLTIAGPTAGDDQSIIIDGGAVMNGGTLDCSLGHRVLNVTTGATVATLELKNLTLQNGCLDSTGQNYPGTSGAGLDIENPGTMLMLDHVLITNNTIIGANSDTATVTGAGVATSGPFNIQDSTFSSNTLQGQTTQGAGLSYSAPYNTAVTQNLAISGSTFSNNRATTAFGNNRKVSGVGAFIDFSPASQYTGTLKITNTTFSGNASNETNLSGNPAPVTVSYGAGLYITQAPDLQINNNDFTNNTLTNAGGTIYGVGAYINAAVGPAGSVPNINWAIQASRFENNTGNGTGSGGGLELDTGPGQITIKNSRFSSNQFVSMPEGGADGGGAAVSSTLDTDQAVTLQISGSEFTDNTLTDSQKQSSVTGGGLSLTALCGEAACGAYTATLNNSTFSHNQLSGKAAYGGGIIMRDNNSGINPGLTKTITVNNVTIAGNSIDIDYTNGGNAHGGGLAVLNTKPKISNTLIANNTFVKDGAAPDCANNAKLGADASRGSIDSAGYNLIGNADGCTLNAIASDQVGTATSPIDPKIMAVADNGGPTRTNALLAGSPAVDAGNPTPVGGGAPTCESIDQRGETRPKDGNGSGTAICDIGAFERKTNEPPSITNPIADQALVLGQGNFTVDLNNVFTDPEGGDMTFSATSSNPSVATGTVSGSTLTIAQQTAGTAKITVTAMDPAGGTTPTSATVTVTKSDGNPIVLHPIPDLNLRIGGEPGLINLSEIFSDPQNLPLTFSASSSNPSVVSVSIQGNSPAVLKLVALSSGTATVTITASNTGHLLRTTTYSKMTISGPGASATTMQTGGSGGCVMNRRGTSPFDPMLWLMFIGAASGLWVRRAQNRSKKKNC